jgi:hypothetical protein
MSVTLNLPINLDYLEHLKREAIDKHHAVSYYLGDAFFIQEECKRLGWNVKADGCGWEITVTPESPPIFTTVFSHKFEEEILNRASLPKSSPV